MPRMSAYRPPWQVKTSPSPSVLRVVAPSVHFAGERGGDLGDTEQRLGGERVGRRWRHLLVAWPRRVAALEDPLGVELGPYAGGVGHQRARDQHRGDRSGRPDRRVRAAAGRAGSHQDRGTRPAHRVGRWRERLEDLPDRRGRDVAVHGELRGRGLQLALGGGPGDADLAGHVVHRQRGEVGEQQHLALGGGQLRRARRGWRGPRGRGPSAGPTSGPCCAAGRGSRPAGGRSPRAGRAARPCASGARRRPVRRGPPAARRAGRR